MTATLQLHYTSYTTPQLQLHYATTTTTAAVHHTTSSSCGWGDHCNHCNSSNKHKSNHLSVNQWIRSAIRESQQPTSPIGFLFWNFRHRLVWYYWYITNLSSFSRQELNTGSEAPSPLRRIVPLFEMQLNGCLVALSVLKDLDKLCSSWLETLPTETVSLVLWSKTINSTTHSGIFIP